MAVVYRAYIKDCLNLSGLPKKFVTVETGDVAGDALTNASSSFEVYDDITDDVNLGDVICLYGKDGSVMYQGVISSLSFDKDAKVTEIDTNSICNLFDMDWFYRVYKEDHLEHEIADIFNDFIAHKIGYVVTTLPTANEDNWMQNRLYYRKETRNNAQVYVGYRIVKQVTNVKKSGSSEYTQKVEYLNVDLGILDSQTPEDYQEDVMFNQKYSVFNVTYEDSQEVHLPGLEDANQMRNMEEFIYSLFTDYGIVVDITIPYEGPCQIHIKTADYEGTKIARNAASIISISPTTETEETNKLLVFSSSGLYRKAYYATTEGITEDSSSEYRLPIINTEYVYSDEALDDIKAQYLKDEMFNHEIVFNMVLDNNLYDFYSWRLGQPLEVYYRGAYYKSVFTGYRYSFSERAQVDTVEITCGKVRQKLTDLINIKKM